MSLRLAHPELPTCDDCEEWLYDPKSWIKVERPRGTPVKRPAGGKPPCYKCPKIRRGDEPVPANGRKHELTEAGWQIYQHYLRCRAVGRFPHDRLVEHHAAIIRDVEDQCSRTQALEPVLAFAELFSKKG